MNLTTLIVDSAGILLIAFIAWFFWGKSKKGTLVATAEGDIQDIPISVKGGYTPDVIVAKINKPIRLRFTRRESSRCSEQVVFPDIGIGADLPEGTEVVIDVKVEKTGVYDFHCGMGMLHGKLIVE